MASNYESPVAAVPTAAIAALEADLPIVLGERTIDDVGWIRHDPLTLIVPMSGLKDGKLDLYFLRLGFGYYRAWPPSARFVNPKTLEYRGAEDACWLPKIEGSTEIHVHANYNNTGQLICCSNTLEFYQVNHDVLSHLIWDSKTQNFAATINAIRGALRSNFYQGRQP